jgi:hypothetical protein
MGYGPPPQPPQRSGLSGWQIAAISLGSVAVALLGLGVILIALGAHRPNTTTPNGGGGVNSVTAITSGPAMVVGSTITENGVSCTLVSVHVIQGDGSIEPDAGKEFIVVTVKIVNRSGREFDYNPFDFHTESGSGNITDHELLPPTTYTGKNELKAGTLADGGTVTGDMVFQVGIGDHKAALTWQPGVFGNKTDNAWNLGI